ncbi:MULTISPECIES: GUN4 domain-containing protein [unclassified Anabaena]|uniref:GUN4 domain-containing protein n=1 Tax=unclassified Anabaena TaxID=2619674 RepID=UPI0039C63D56
MASPLPLLAQSQSTTDDNRTPFCQVIEAQASPYLDVTALLDAIEQGGDLNQLCDFYGQRSLLLNLLISVDAPVDETTAELQQLLRAQSWAAADRETRRLLAPDSVVTQSAPGAPAIAPEMIRAIDQAWLTASNGRFGLSVQLRLWQAVQAAHANDQEAAVNAFRDRIGWKIPAPREETDFISSDWRNESELTYSLEAPKGHLPWAGVSDEVVQAVAVPPPGVHCGVCTADAMALRHSRFYGRIPELMDTVAMATVATAMNPLTCQATAALGQDGSLTYQVSGTVPAATNGSALQNPIGTNLSLTVQRRDAAGRVQTWLNPSALSDYAQIAPDADYSRLPFPDSFRAQANSAQRLYSATASVNGLYISLRPLSGQPQQMQVVHYLRPGQYVRSSVGTCRTE